MKHIAEQFLFPFITPLFPRSWRRVLVSNCCSARQRGEVDEDGYGRCRRCLLRCVFIPEDEFQNYE